jgi:tRNA1(Val) A37 N6-methylase TrmN6
MTEADRERLRRTFGEDAELYDQYRPGYPLPLFDDLAILAGIGSRSRVLEIGCGTGQATLPMARLGCTITAVELDADMARMAQRNLAGASRVEIVVSAFEDWELPTQAFDLVMSATAFLDRPGRAHD